MSTKKSTSTSTNSKSTHPLQTTSARWASFRERMRVRRQERAAHDRMMRELDTYHSRSEIEDLLAAADRSNHPDAEITRAVLHAKLRSSHALMAL